MTLRHRHKMLGTLALLCIGLQVKGTLVMAGLALTLWLSGLVLFDRTSLKRFWMPRFWLFSILLAVGSGLLLGKTDIHLLGLGFSLAGLNAGALMVLRGAFVFALTSWASRNIDYLALQKVAARLGISRLAAAVPVAMHLLPELQTVVSRHLTEDKKHKISIHETAVALFCYTATLAMDMSLNTEAGYRMKIPRKGDDRHWD